MNTSFKFMPLPAPRKERRSNRSMPSQSSGSRVSRAGVNNIGRVGTVARTRVCNMEIWCELFGKDQGSLGRAESNNLTAMLTKLGWVRKEKKERVRPYGPQFVFVPGDVPD